jgi:hypothetical protein
MTLKMRPELPGLLLDVYIDMIYTDGISSYPS